MASGYNELEKVSAVETFQNEPSGFKVGRESRFISVAEKAPGTGNPVWRGLLRENFSGLSHMAGEDSASDNWARFGQAVRLTMAAFLQASPQQAGRLGLNSENLNRLADQRISQYVEHFYGSIMPGRTGRSQGEIEATRQCALGNAAACR